MSKPARYICYRAAGPITIDGKLDEPSWRLAPKSAPFIDIVTGEPAWFDTRVALLWDDDHLYFGFWVEEPRIYASLTKRDSKIWEENDVEVFIAGKDAYYEFEINAINTVYEVFWIWKDILKRGSPYYGRPEFDPATQRTMVLDGVGGHVHERGERWGFLDWDYPGLRTAVEQNARGWTVELAFPWRGLELIADARSLPPKDGDVWRIDCSRFEMFDREGKRVDPCFGWTWNRHGHYDSHIPEVFPYVTFSKTMVSETEALRAR
jgi:hypothetical protein